MEFSNTIMQCVSFNPSRIIVYFKNSLRGAINIPLGVIRVLFKRMCNNKGEYSYINTKCYKVLQIGSQLAHRHIKPTETNFPV